MAPTAKAAAARRHELDIADCLVTIALASIAAGLVTLIRLARRAPK